MMPLQKAFTFTVAAALTVGLLTPLAAQTKEINRDDVEQASLVIDDLTEQLRIAQAKLQPDSLKRKQTIGRLQAFKTAADNEIRTLAMQTEREVERNKQIGEQLAGIAKIRKSQGVDNGRLEKLIAQSQSAVDRSKEQLERVSRQRTRIEQKIQVLRAEHITGLLEAGVKRTIEVGRSVGSSLGDLLDTELGDPPSVGNDSPE